MKNIKLLWIACLFACSNLLPLTGFAQEFDDLNDQADKEYAANNYQKAMDLANRAISIKVNARSYFIRADCRFSLKDYDAALTDYNTAISDYTNYYTTDKYKGRMYYWRGRCKQKLTKYDDAITDFNASFTYSYEEPGYAYWNRGNCYYELGEYQKGDDDYANSIDKLTDTKDLAKLYKYRGDCQADPQAGADQKLARMDLCQRIHRHATRGERGTFRAAAQPVPQQGAEMRSVEGNLLDDADREQR